MYKLDLKTRKCNITVPHRGWIPRDPHPGDKFMSINIIGASGYPKEKITVLQFVSNKTQGDLTRLSNLQLWLITLHIAYLWNYYFLLFIIMYRCL